MIRVRLSPHELSVLVAQQIRYDNPIESQQHPGPTTVTFGLTKRGQVDAYVSFWDSEDEMQERINEPVRESAPLAPPITITIKFLSFKEDPDAPSEEE